ncbi:hypothetical protein ACOT81_37030 [Streptomyces sp. WI04-05B]|uniref:hypothetical protein n=1 Tax=Streptomyces TaxID=1883 RepID=UPI0029AD33A0|nr:MULTISPECIES: hypothetical protein [unclassified Streptomyces]MDX2546409.1 hypothetical protein [Streptomyces sp. WI04-05B]MDX2586230.1 hypothetical protein [Streptomyces sp. WI04-05A]MDX3748880.1 hypothetical protein [Streptomyces sp. AK08-02]
MQREDLPDSTTGSGLSTDDLAHPRDTYTGDGTADTSAEVPTFPGESTTTPSDPAEDEPEATDSGTRDEMTETGSDAQRHRAAGPGDRAEDEAPQLLTPEDEEGFRTRWQEVQNEFVDDPRDAVHTADALVAEVMQKLAATFADHKQELEGQWNRGGQANTEDLRLALRHYRSFFNRLLVT